MHLQIQELKIPFFLGIYDKEKTNKTIVIFDISLNFNPSKFRKTRAFKDVIDYDTLIQLLIKTFENSTYNLIEDVLLKLSEILSNLKLSGEVRVSKQGTHENVKMISMTAKF